MKKTFIFFSLLSLLLFLVNVEKVWADPSSCQGSAGCVLNKDCKTRASSGTCTTDGYICCEEKNTSSSSSTSSGTGIQVPTDTGLPSGDIMSILSKTLDWIEGIFLTLSLISFAIVGIMFLFSLGNANSSAHTNAKAYFNQAITALLIVGSSYILIKTINYLLQG